MLKFIYTVFVGILIAVFIGLGIDAFYPGPTMPEYPESKFYYEPQKENPSDEELALMEEEQNQYTAMFETYSEQLKTYNRDVSIIALIGAIIVLTASILLEKQLKLIADGLILGGVLTLTYSIIRGFNAGDQMFRFVMVTIGLAIAILLGYLKFLKPEKQTIDS